VCPAVRLRRYGRLGGCNDDPDRSRHGWPRSGELSGGEGHRVDEVCVVGMRFGATLAAQVRRPTRDGSGCPLDPCASAEAFERAAGHQHHHSRSTAIRPTARGDPGHPLQRRDGEGYRGHLHRELFATTRSSSALLTRPTRGKPGAAQSTARQRGVLARRGARQAQFMDQYPPHQELHEPRRSHRRVASRGTRQRP